jgi:hypothetical protein
MESRSFLRWPVQSVENKNNTLYGHARSENNVSPNAPPMQHLDHGSKNNDGCAKAIGVLQKPLSVAGLEGTFYFPDYFVHLLSFVQPFPGYC